MHKASTYGLIGLLGNGTTECIDDETLVLSVLKSVYFFLIWICFSLNTSDISVFGLGEGGGSRMA
jgi:hypothetical protein